MEVKFLGHDLGIAKQMQNCALPTMVVYLCGCGGLLQVMSCLFLAICLLHAGSSMRSVLLLSATFQSVAWPQHPVALHPRPSSSRIGYNLLAMLLWPKVSAWKKNDILCACSFLPQETYITWIRRQSFFFGVMNPTPTPPPYTHTHTPHTFFNSNLGSHLSTKPILFWVWLKWSQVQVFPSPVVCAANSDRLVISLFFRTPLDPRCCSLFLISLLLRWSEFASQTKGSHISLSWGNRINIDGLVQDCSISIANALEILQSCTRPLIWFVNTRTTVWGNLCVFGETFLICTTRSSFCFETCLFHSAYDSCFSVQFSYCCETYWLDIRIYETELNQLNFWPCFSHPWLWFIQ